MLKTFRSENDVSMTANKRIFLNVIATYGRSLFGLACGLFSARWVLEALGKEDFGLYGVVGALTIFISFLNMMLSGALGRYYAFSIGEAKKAADNGRAADGLENCRRWFNTALSIHTIVPVVLMLIGYALWQMFGGLDYIFRKAMRGRIAAVGCPSMGAGSIGGKNYCGNLLW